MTCLFFVAKRKFVTFCQPWKAFKMRESCVCCSKMNWKVPSMELLVICSFTHYTEHWPRMFQLSYLQIKTSQNDNGNGVFKRWRKIPRLQGWVGFFQGEFELWGLNRKETPMITLSHFMAVGVWSQNGEGRRSNLTKTRQVLSSFHRTLCKQIAIFAL